LTTREDRTYNAAVLRNGQSGLRFVQPRFQRTLPNQLFRCATDRAFYGDLASMEFLPNLSRSVESICDKPTLCNCSTSQSQVGVLRERITALWKGEPIQVQPIGERENPETKSSGTGVPTPSMSENPGEGLSFSPFLPPDPGKGWADKAKEIPIIGNIVGKTEPLYDEYLKP